MMPRSFRNTLRSWVLVLGLSSLWPAHAQFTSDIDIYSGNQTASEAPNVLFVLDNTANWSTAFTNEIAALVSIFNSREVNRFRIGLMMFSESGTNNGGQSGGYVRAASRLLTDDYKTKMKALLESLHVTNDRASGGKAGLTMAEAYYYFAGKAPFAGRDKEKVDFTGNVGSSLTAASSAIYALPGNALSIRNASTYNSPVSNVCARNYIIYISNGPVQDNDADSREASTRLSAAYNELSVPRPADLVLSPSGSQSGLADEWARFMKTTPQNISTYTIDVNPGTTGQGPGWTALLQSMAKVSGGQYYAVNSSVNGGNQLVLAGADIFNQIQSVDSVFASATLPVSVSARGTYLNQIYMGLFRPDGNGNPRWRGNLKQYKFGYEPATDTLFLSDAGGNPAITGTTGFLSPSAVSFWTQTSTFWTNQPSGTPPSVSDSPDGAVVEKGGVAQLIRSAQAISQATRPVYTCLSCAANTNLANTAAAQFSTANSGITATDLGVSAATAAETALQRAAIIEWVRGTDNAGDEAGPGGSTTVRPSVHGDVLHSRPAVVNYGDTTGVVVFYGANDGQLRAVNGNATGTGAGSELWSFIPSEHLPRLKRLRSNSPEIRLSTTLAPTAATPRDYFVDGPISIYQKRSASGTSERVILYAAMRRGGRFLYALDITNPAQPLFLWKKSQADIAVLGQTWSEPKVARIKGHTNPVLIMGAGYDAAAEDQTPRGTTTMGNAVLVLDALNGDLLKQFNTDRSVPADVAVLDPDNDGFVDRAYAVDVAGMVYRLDFEKATSASVTSSVVADWGMFKLASLSGTGVRKFFYQPDVIPTKIYTALLVGSGDREKPLSNTSTDAFFTLYDRQLSKGTPTSFTTITADNLGRIDTSQNATAGCFWPLDTAGEKVVNAPLTVAGVTYFGTNKPTAPNSNACSANLGISQLYQFPLFCKAPTTQQLTGGGMPPSPVGGVVAISYTADIDGDGDVETVEKKLPFLIGGPNSKGSSMENTDKDLFKKFRPLERKRSYWFLKDAR